MISNFKNIFKKVKKDELTKNLVLNSRNNDFYSLMNSLPNPDPILKKLGKDVSIYKSLLTDPVVGGVVRRRKASVLKQDFRILQENADKKVFEFIENIFNDLNIYEIINDILNAALFGYQPLEVIWTFDNAKAEIKSIEARPPEFFVFNKDLELCLKTGDFAEKSEPVPAFKFLLPRQNHDFNNPYGVGDLALVYWAVVFKKAGLKFWAVFTEKYGAPWLIAYEPRSNTADDTDKLLDSLEALANDAVGVIPEDSRLEIKESVSKGASVDAFERLIKYCRSEISIALLGQDQTTEKDTNHASATAGLLVAEDIKDKDTRLVNSVFNQLIEWICLLNFGDVDLPKFELYEEEDNLLLIERDLKLKELGVNFSKDYIKNTYSLADEDIDNIQAPSLFAKSTTNFAESEIKPISKQIGEDILEKIYQALEDSPTLDAFNDSLIDVFTKFNIDLDATEFAQKSILENLKGRSEVAIEVKKSLKGQQDVYF